MDACMHARACRGDLMYGIGASMLICLCVNVGDILVHMDSWTCGSTCDYARCGTILDHFRTMPDLHRARAVEDSKTAAPWYPSKLAGSSLEVVFANWGF